MRLTCTLNIFPTVVTAFLFTIMLPATRLYYLRCKWFVSNLEGRQSRHACNHHEKHHMISREKLILAESWELCLFMANILPCSVIICDLPLGSVIGSHFQSHHIDLWLLTWPCLHGHLMSLADVGKELKHVLKFWGSKVGAQLSLSQQWKTICSASKAGIGSAAKELHRCMPWYILELVFAFWKPLEEKKRKPLPIALDKKGSRCQELTGNHKLDRWHVTRSRAFRWPCFFDSWDPGSCCDFNVKAVNAFFPTRKMKTVISPTQNFHFAVFFKAPN